MCQNSCTTIREGGWWKQTKRAIRNEKLRSEEQARCQNTGTHHPPPPFSPFPLEILHTAPGATKGKQGSKGGGNKREAGKEGEGTKKGSREQGEGNKREARKQGEGNKREAGKEHTTSQPNLRTGVWWGGTDGTCS